MKCVGDEYQDSGIKQLHRGNARRGIAQIGAADVARFNFGGTLLCGSAARAVNDINFVMIQG